MGRFSCNKDYFDRVRGLVRSGHTERLGSDGGQQSTSESRLRLPSADDLLRKGMTKSIKYDVTRSARQGFARRGRSGHGGTGRFAGRATPSGGRRRPCYNAGMDRDCGRHRERGRSPQRHL